MILPDVNVLVYAHNIDSKDHLAARSWWESCLAGSQGIGLAWVTVLGFVRIVTNQRIVSRPQPVGAIFARIDQWLALPHVHWVEPSKTHFDTLRAELERLGTAGNLTTDAHLAVLAMERGYTLYSTDVDFARFKGLRWINPCAQ
jgi:uncharacterized protein